ncbi:hypothetical protein SEUCBS139899_002467 [Sporothrix eucalyptigena]|uniref:Uncharacterized protein n=1 Tax=Sporothrix eucalyptigena TaxID=1812306 RepID=A0ABP0B4Y8_9PEZI
MADVPIALRRTRRSTSSLSNAFHAVGGHASVPSDVPTPPLTPSSSSSKRSLSSRLSLSSRSTPSTPSSRQARRPKRVRFSDPGQLTSQPSSPATPSCNCSSTGLTPFVKRASLQTGLPVSGDVHFLPLRQVLDGRVQRRLRRNGLSEEMNSLHAEKRQKAKAVEVELARLREEVAAKDEQIRRLQTTAEGDPDDTIFQDNDRVMALQREVGVLRRQLASRPVEVDVETPPHDRTYNWTMAARDPFGSTISGDDDMTEVMDDRDDGEDGPPTIEVDGNDIFGDATMAELQCSTPSRPRVQRQQQQHHAAKYDNDSQRTLSFSMSLRGGGSFPTPPATSPVAWTDEAGVGEDDDDNGIPMTPVTPSMHLFSTRRVSPTPMKTATSEAEVQAMLPDPETDLLREEVTSLKQIQDGLEERITCLVRDLADKTAAFEGLSTSLRAFMPDNTNDDSPPLDAADIVDRLGAAFRTARLELEYLTPGEIEQPLTAPVAEVLDLLLGRLRQLSQQAHEADAQIDEYHAIESDLRQQLGARVSAMDALVKEVANKEATIKDLEVGADRFKGALASYARDVTELEAVVHKLEASLKEKDAKVTSLTAAHAQHGLALALRDARVHELRNEIEQNNATLRASQRNAHEATRQLRNDNSSLQAQLEAETQRAAAAKEAVATLQALLETEAPKEDGRKEKRLSLGKRLFRRSSGASSAVTTAGANAVTMEGTEAATPSRSTKKRRRYDSGLGFLDEEEA